MNFLQGLLGGGGGAGKTQSAATAVSDAGSSGGVNNSTDLTPVYVIAGLVVVTLGVVLVLFKSK